MCRVCKFKAEVEVRRDEDGRGGGGGGEGRTWKLGEFRVVNSFPDGAGGRRPPLQWTGFPGAPLFFTGQPRAPAVCGGSSPHVMSSPLFGIAGRRTLCPWEVHGRDARNLGKIGVLRWLPLHACLSGGQVHGLRITSDYSVGEDPPYFVLRDTGARCLV